MMKLSGLILIVACLTLITKAIGEEITMEHVFNEIGSTPATYWDGRPEKREEGLHIEIPEVWSIGKNVTLPVSSLFVNKKKDAFKTMLSYDVVLIAVNHRSGKVYGNNFSMKRPPINENYKPKNPELLNRSMNMIDGRKTLSLPWFNGSYTFFATAHDEVLKTLPVNLVDGRDESVVALTKLPAIDEIILSKTEAVEEEGIAIAVPDAPLVQLDIPYPVEISFRLPKDAVTKTVDTEPENGLVGFVPIGLVMYGERSVSPVVVNRSIKVTINPDSDVVAGVIVVDLDEFVYWNDSDEELHLFAFVGADISDRISIPVRPKK